MITLTTATITNTHIRILGLDSQASSLNPARLINESFLNNDGCHTCRCIGPFSWMEDEQMASLNARVDFIKQVTLNVMLIIPARDTPITFISLGAGKLLTEFLINRELKNAGYKDLSWRIIDVAYQNSEGEQCCKKFAETVNNVEAFTSEQSYLNMQLESIKLAENDKNRGATILLAIDPPRVTASVVPDLSHSLDCMCLRGAAVGDVKKANAIYLAVTPNNEKETLDQAQRILAEENCVGLDCGVRCSIDKHGDYAVSYSPSEKGKAINKEIVPYLTEIRRICKLTETKIELSDIDLAFDAYLTQAAKNGRSGIKFYASDYDKSVINLWNYLIDSNHQVFYASFVNNEAYFTSKE